MNAWRGGVNIIPEFGHKALNQARENEGGSAGFHSFLPVYKIDLRLPRHH